MEIHNYHRHLYYQRKPKITISELSVTVVIDGGSGLALDPEFTLLVCVTSNGLDGSTPLNATAKLLGINNEH